jgi:hypothetical protein
MLASLALALAATVLASPAAHAGPVVVDQSDPVGDVSIFDGGGTKPSTAQRRSIDLERFSMTRTEDGLRLAFRIARITGSRTFDQIVEAHFRTSGGRADLDVLANPQHGTATAYLSDEHGGMACLVDVSSVRASGTVRVDLPRGCFPRDEGVLRVTTYTQEKNGSGPGFSEDTMRVRGHVSL